MDDHDDGHFLDDEEHDLPMDEASMIQQGEGGQVGAVGTGTGDGTGDHMPRRRARPAATTGAFNYEEPPEAVDVAELFPCSDEFARPQVCNVIADVRLPRDRPIDLIKLATSVRDVELHASRKAAVLRIREPRCCVTVRQLGQLTLTGCRSLAAAKHCAALACKVIRKAMGWSVEDLSAVQFTLHTSTVRFDLKHPIRLEALAAKYPQQISYEPENFCAANLRMTGVIDAPPEQPLRWAVVASVFASGKVVLNGACSAVEVTCAYNAILRILQPFATEVPKPLLQQLEEEAKRKPVAANRARAAGGDDDDDEDSNGSGTDNDMDGANQIAPKDVPDEDDPFAAAAAAVAAEGLSMAMRLNNNNKNGGGGGGGGAAAAAAADKKKPPPKVRAKRAAAKKAAPGPNDAAAAFAENELDF